MRATGNGGLVNKDGNICRYGKFGYRYLNDKNRITRPLLKKNGKFTEVSFKKAFEVIKENADKAEPGENALYGGARLTNEELYLIQKLARAGFRSPNVNSFHYLAGGKSFINNTVANTSFEQLEGASRIYLLGSEINTDNPVPGYIINKLREVSGVPVELITCKSKSSMEHKVDRVLKIKSYYHLVKALNYYYLSSGMENSLFIKNRCSGFQEYKNNLLREDYDSLIKSSGIGSRKRIGELAGQFNKEMNAVLVFSEKEVSPNTSLELMNLAIITGKLGKTSQGLIALKEKNNSQGLFDMGMFDDLLPGGGSISDKEIAAGIQKAWKLKSLPLPAEKDNKELLDSGAFRNMFIFGEDPVGCAVDGDMVNRWLEKAGFVMVQDYFMTDTASVADLVLPAALPFESGGSYSNTQKMIQQFDKQFDGIVELSGYEQLLALLEIFGFNGLSDLEDVRKELYAMLSLARSADKLDLKYTGEDNHRGLFRHGCDNLVKRFDEEFAASFR